MKNFKKDFPMFVHNPKLVYLDSAATSQKPKTVFDAISDYYTNYNANVRRGIYPIAEKATEKVEEVRKQVAKFINAKDPSEIIFVRNTTEAINLIAYAWGKTNIKKGDTIVTTIMEHHSNFVPWQQLCLEKDAKLEVVDIDNTYYLSSKIYDLKNVRLLAITQVSNVLGTINPIKEIIKRVRKINKDIIILVDGAQSVPHMNVDVQDLDCDFLAFSGHKTLASTGIGVLYGKKKILETMPPFLYGSDMIREVSLEKSTFDTSPGIFEAGTPDIAGIVSLGAAIEYLEKVGMDTIRKHEQELVAYCLSLLSNIDGVSVYGSKDSNNRGGVISFNLDGVHPHDVAQVLGDLHICIRAGHHCAMPLHTRLGIPATSRVSFSLYNTQQDIDAFIKGLYKVKKLFRT